MTATAILNFTGTSYVQEVDAERYPIYTNKI